MSDPSVDVREEDAFDVDGDGGVAARSTATTCPTGRPRCGSSPAARRT